MLLIQAVWPTETKAKRWCLCINRDLGRREERVILLLNQIECLCEFADLSTCYDVAITMSAKPRKIINRFMG